MQPHLLQFANDIITHPRSLYLMMSALTLLRCERKTHFFPHNYNIYLVKNYVGANCECVDFMTNDSILQKNDELEKYAMGENKDSV